MTCSDHYLKPLQSSDSVTKKSLVFIYHTFMCHQCGEVKVVEQLTRQIKKKYKPFWVWWLTGRNKVYYD